jgi:hypothetical protein
VTDPTGVDHEATVRAHHEVLIHAPLSHVWNLHTDVNAWPSWQTDISEAHIDGEMEPGNSFEWTIYNVRVQSTVYDVAEHQRVVWGGTTGEVTGIHEWLFAETSKGVRVATTDSLSGNLVDADREAMQNVLDASLVAWLTHMKAAEGGHP